jgi:drug/metabolite transporter (DMT)-like permease
VPDSSHRLAWIAWATVCVVWGTTYLAIKVALETLPPFLMGGIRHLLAGALLAGLVLWRGHRLPPRSEWGRLVVLGLCLVFLGNSGVVWAVQHVPSGLTSVLIASVPFWMTGVDGALAGGQPLRPRQWIGLAVGFAGIVLLVSPDIAAGGRTGRDFLIGVLSAQLGCAGWAVGSAYTRRHVLRGDIFVSAAIQMLAGGAMMFAVGTALGEWSRLSFNGSTTIAFAYLVLMGSIVAFGAYSYALQHLEMAVVSLYTYINPVIAVALGTLVLGEPFHARMAVAAALVLVGVVIVSRRRLPVL